MNREVVLKTEGITKTFGSRTAVDRVDLEIFEGDIYCLLGGNGAGKTTLFRMLAGLIWPTRGTIDVCGGIVTPIHKGNLSRVGSHIDKTAFCDFMSARENVAMASSIYGNGSREKVDEALNIVGLARRRNDKVSTFSHGMRKRLAIAQSLAGGPRLLILDEPFSGLDPIGIEAIWKILIFLNEREKMTILFSNHMVSIAEKFCNRIGIMHRGKRVYQGEKSSLSQDSTVSLESAYLDLIHHSSSIDGDEE